MHVQARTHTHTHIFMKKNKKFVFTAMDLPKSTYQDESHDSLEARLKIRPPMKES